MRNRPVYFMLLWLVVVFIAIALSTTFPTWLRVAFGLVALSSAVSAWFVSRPNKSIR